MNTIFRNSILFAMLFITTAVVAQPVLWPILQNDNPCQNNNPPDGECWQAMNCTFGEIHGEGTQNYPYHFHGAVDIDTADNVPVRAVEAGRILNRTPQNPDNLNHTGCGNRMVTIEHEPIVNGRYTRRTRYLHIDPDCGNLPLGNPVAAQTVLGSVHPDYGHLHFELWQLENGEWKMVDPPGNQSG